MNNKNLVLDLYNQIKLGLTPKNAIMSIAGKYEINKYLINEDKSANVWSFRIDLGLDNQEMNFELPRG